MTTQIDDITQDDVVVAATAGNDPVVDPALSPDGGGPSPEPFDPQKHVPITLYRKMQSSHDKLANEVAGLRTQFDSAVAQAVSTLPGDLQKQMATVQLGMSILHYAKTYNIPAEVLQTARTPQEAAEIALAYVAAGRETVVGEPLESAPLITTSVGGGVRQPPASPVVSPAVGVPQVTGGQMQERKGKLAKMNKSDPGYRALWLEIKRQEQLPQAKRVGGIL